MWKQIMDELYKANQEHKEKETKFSWWGVLGIIGLILVWIVITIYDQGEYPKLHSFGIKDWSVRCQGLGREYRLLSSVDRSAVEGSSGRLSHRTLNFLDQDSNTLYKTSVFDKSSLDKEGLWRFKYRSFDIRLVGKKDQSKVLRGDEVVFEIAEDFKSMLVITKDEQKLKLSCQSF